MIPLLLARTLLASIAALFDIVMYPPPVVDRPLYSTDPNPRPA